MKYLLALFLLLPLPASAQNAINASDNGVLCNGSTDDTAALTALAATAGGKHIIFPTGTCRVANVTWPANVRLSGQGGNGSCLTTMQRPPSTVATMFTLGANTLMEDMCIDGNYAQNVGQPDLISIYSYSGPTTDNSFDRMMFFGSQSTDLANFGKMSVTGSLFLGPNSPTVGSAFGIWTDQKNNRLNVAGSTFRGYRLNAIIGQGRTQITDSFFEGNHCQVSPTGGGQIDLGGMFIASGIHVENGCGIHSSGIEAVGSLSLTGSRIRNNAGGGIVLENTDELAPNGNHVITGNVIDYNGGGGVGVFSSFNGAVISGNKFTANGAYAVQLSGTTDYVAIVGNAGYGNASGVVNIGSGTHNVIVNNPGM